MVDANCDLCGGSGYNTCGACYGKGLADPNPSIADYTGGSCKTCDGSGQIDCVKCNKKGFLEKAGEKCSVMVSTSSEHCCKHSSFGADDEQ